MLENYPDATDVVTVKMNNTIKEVKETFTAHPDIDNVVILEYDEDEDVIKGILYKVDLTEEIGAKFQGPDELDDKPLKVEITKILTDNATNTAWKTTGIENFVILLNKDDTFEDAKKKMDAKGGVTVRGMVVDEGEPTGIIDFQMLSSE